MKYKEGWPRLVHLSTDYTRDSGTTTMCTGGLKGRYTVQSCCPPSYMEPRPGQVKRITWMDKVTNKDILKRTSDQKEPQVDWTPHEDVTKQATKADSLLSTVFWLQKERAPSSPVQGYHQEKSEAESHKDLPMDITLPAER